MLKLGVTLGRESSEKTAIEKRICTPINYVSDFSKGTDGWSGQVGISALTADQSIGGISQALTITFASPKPGATGGATIFNLLPVTLSVGCEYAFNLQYRLKSTNDEITFLESIDIGEEPTIIDTRTVTQDTWLTRSGTFTPTVASNIVSIVFNTLDTTGSDLAYLYDIRIFSNF